MVMMHLLAYELVTLVLIYDFVVALNELHFLTNVLKGFFGKRYSSCIYNFLSAYVGFRNQFLKDKFSFMGLRAYKKYRHSNYTRVFVTIQK